MRKEVANVGSIAQQIDHIDHTAEWLDIEQIARVELTSEDQAFPIENAVSTNRGGRESGWRAGSPGPQTISLLFDTPQRVRKVSVRFIERIEERDQEFVLRYSSSAELNREIVRQQWTFSPNGFTQETEDYRVDLHSVTKIEIIIDPGRGRGQSRATLNALRVA